MIKTTRRHQQNIGLPQRLKSNKQTIQKSIERTSHQYVCLVSRDSKITTLPNKLVNFYHAILQVKYWLNVISHTYTNKNKQRVRASVKLLF